MPKVHVCICMHAMPVCWSSILTAHAMWGRAQLVTVAGQHDIAEYSQDRWFTVTSNARCSVNVQQTNE